MIFKKEHKIPSIVFLVITCLAFVFVLIKEPIISPGTIGFVKARLKLTSGYTFFMIVYKKLFGAEPFWPILITHFIVVTGALWFFVKQVVLKLNLKLYQQILMIGVLFYPIFDVNLHVVNNITSGAFSYAIYLIILGLLYDVYLEGKQKRFAILIPLLIVLILMRSQFNFLLVALLFFEIIRFIRTRQFNLKHSILVLIVPVVIGATDKLYHSWIHNESIRTPFTWISLNTAMMFVSDISDAEFIEDEEDKGYFLMVKQSLKEKKMRYEDNMFGPRPEFTYVKFHYELPVICNEVIHTDGVRYFMKKDQSNLTQATLKTEQTNKRLFFTLLPDNFQRWAGLILYSVFFGLGGMFMTLLWVLLWIYLFRSFWKEGSLYNLNGFLWLLLTCMLFNSMLVALSVHSISRYYFYNYWVPIMIAFVLFNQFKKNKV